MSKWFWKDAAGVNADIERHRQEELHIQAKITELEGKSDPMSVRSLAAYRHFLKQLRDSKAKVVSQLGCRP